MDYIHLGFLTFSFEEIGFFALFIGMFLDGANVPFTPTEFFLVTAGSLARAGEFKPLLAYAVCVAGSLAGHAISYTLGRHIGRPFLDRYGASFRVRPENVERLQKTLEKYGTKAPFVVRFIPGLRSFSSFMFGVLHTPQARFWAYTTFGVALYNAIFFLLGFVAGGYLLNAPHLGRYLLAGVILLSVIASGVTWYRWRRADPVETP